MIINKHYIILFQIVNFHDASTAVVSSMHNSAAMPLNGNLSHHCLLMKSRLKILIYEYTKDTDSRVD